MQSADDQEIPESLKLLSEITPTVEDTDRAVARVRAALATGPQPQFKRIGRLAMFARIAAGVVALVGTIVGVSWLLKTDASTTVAFAQVQEKVEKTKTLCLTELIEEDGRPARSTRIMILDSAHIRGEASNGITRISDYKQHRELMIDPMARRSMVRLGVTSAFNMYDRLRNFLKDPVKTLPDRQINGKRAVGFLVREGDHEISVWVDPQTKLPVQLEETYPIKNVATLHGDGKTVEIPVGKTPETGRTMKVTTKDIEFDGKLDAALFSTTPPPDCVVANRRKERPNLKLSCFVGIGPARAGMSKDEVIQSLGEPDWIDARDDGGASLLYSSWGFRLEADRKQGLSSIWCYTQKMPMNGEEVQDFPGSTKEGIAMGANAAAIKRAYGNPDREDSQGAEADLFYRRLKLLFHLSKDRLHLIHHGFNPPGDPQS